MEKAVQAWYNNYYGKELGGRHVDSIDALTEQKIKADYEELFVKPITFMATGEYAIPENKSVLNNVLVQLSQGPITDWMYLLNYWIDNGFFVYTGDLAADYKACIAKTRSDMRVLFATSGSDCKDISLHTHNGRIVDKLPMKLLVYPKSMNAHFGGHRLSDLAGTDPRKLTGEERAFLASAVYGGYIPESDLKVVSVPVPSSSIYDIKEVTLNALSTDLPPCEFYTLADALPTATIVDSANIFDAVHKYMEGGSTVSDVVSNYISRYVFKQQTPSATITDEQVVQYMRDVHNLECDVISDLYVPNKAHMGIATAIDPDVLKGSAQDLLEALSSAQDVQADTLDVIIQNFCKENNISTQCTIDQLIEVINYDVHPMPVSPKDIVAKAVAEENISLDTTLDEYIKGQKHTPLDVTGVVLDWLVDTDIVSGDLEDQLRSCILYDKQFEPEVDSKNAVLELLPSIGLDDNLLSRIMIAVQNGTKVEGIETAKVINEPLSKERAYTSGEYLLRKVREEITKDSSWQNREKLTPILYMFLRLLMCNIDSEYSDVISMFDEKINAASDTTRQILIEGRNLLQ